MNKLIGFHNRHIVLITDPHIKDDENYHVR